MVDTIVEYGVDICRDWTFQDGDIKSISNTDNLNQAILNRLNTIQDELDSFYDDYGSFLHAFLGWKKNEETLTFIKTELDNVIAKDPRITFFESEVTFDENGSVKIELVISDYGDFSLNYILDGEGVAEVS